MAEQYAEGGVQDSEFGLSIEAISVLDVSERAYFDACADYAERPSQDNLSKINDFTLEQAMAFSKALGMISNENNPETYTVESRALFRGAESRRADFLNAITESEAFWVTEVEMPEDSESTDEISAMQYVLDHWTFRNTSSLQYDTHQFVELVQNSPVAERFKRNEALKQQVLDVAKIALGTSVAIILTSRFRRS
jgi:hypothetical protein